MDFLDPKKKRAHLTRLYIGYGLTAIALAIATFVVMFAAYGYGIDRNTGDIIQNGLIVVDANPESADVYIDNVKRGTTSTRLVLPASTYNVALKREGYRAWTHQVDLEGSSIEQLSYPFLFPTKLVTKTIQEYATAPGLVIQSPDRRWLLVQPQPELPNFTISDLSNNKNVTTTINLPPEILTVTEGASNYEAIEWSSDNTRLVLKHNYNGGSEFILLDRNNPSASVNVNKLFALQAFTNISLRDKKFDQLYLFNSANGNLFSADVPNKTVSLVLTNVISYKSYQADTLAYITNPKSSPSSVEMRILQNKQDYLIRTLPISAHYLLDMAQFNGQFYLVGGSSSDGHIYVIKDPFSDLNRRPSRTPTAFRVLIVAGAKYLSFSDNARNIAVQNGSSFAVFDIETSRQIRYDLQIPIAPEQKAIWMDGHRLHVVSQDKINVFDFDGTNKQILSPSINRLHAFFNRDYDAMYAVAPMPNIPEKTVLTRTELKVLPITATN